MKNTLTLKSIILLLLPLLLFAVLVVPYSYINSEYLVDIFGCAVRRLTNTETWSKIHSMQTMLLRYSGSA